MTEADMQTIERELGITLPEVYRKAVCPYPIPAWGGDVESELWDDASALVKLNRELRGGIYGMQPWPEWLFSVGGDGEAYIGIDLRDPNGPTWWLDHGHISNESSGKTHDCFTSWVNEYVKDIRDDLTGDGYNPDATPEEYAAQAKADAARNSRSCLLVIIVLAAIALLAYFAS